MSLPTSKLPSPIKLSLHKDRWINCTLCGLCKTRTNVVLCRQRLPENGKPKTGCDFLFIGDAPGGSEDSTGKPFTGPSGKLINRLITEAITRAGHEPNIWFTNTLACVPPDSNDENKVRPPTTDEAKACQPRLEELIVSLEPRVILCVGKVAKTLFPRGYNKALQTFGFLDLIDEIAHPTSLLKTKESRRDTECAKVRLKLARLFRDFSLQKR